MMSLVFSDDEDVSTHAAALEQVHSSILYKPQSSVANEIDDKENLSRSVFKNDPVSLRVLADKNRSPGDVFITPMDAPSDLHDVYELPSDSDPEQISFVQPDSCTTASRCSVSGISTLHGLTENKSPLTFSTPRLSYRRRLRLKHAIQPSQSDDDVEYIPKIGTYDHESSSGERTVFTMRLRPQRGLWVPEDDLPLAELKPRVSINIQNKSDGLFNESSQGREPFAGDLNYLKTPSRPFRSLLKAEPMEIRGHLTSEKGSSLINGTNQEVVLTPRAKTKSREGTRKIKSRLDDDYRGPDDDVLLIEIKQRRSTLRSSSKDMCRRQFLSLDMD